MNSLVVQRRIRHNVDVECEQCDTEWEEDQYENRVVAVVLLEPGQSYNPTLVHQAIADELGVPRRELHSTVIGCTDKSELLKERECTSTR